MHIYHRLPQEKAATMWAYNFITMNKDLTAELDSLLSDIFNDNINLEEVNDYD